MKKLVSLLILFSLSGLCLSNEDSDKSTPSDSSNVEAPHYDDDPEINSRTSGTEGGNYDCDNFGGGSTDSSACYNDGYTGPVFKTNDAELNVHNKTSSNEWDWIPYGPEKYLKSTPGDDWDWIPYGPQSSMKSAPGDEWDWIPYGPEKAGQAYRDLFQSTIALKSYVGEDRYLYAQLENGSWIESSSFLEAIKDGSLIVAGAAVLYKIFKSVNPIGIAAGISSAGAYADFTSEILDFPERIFKRSNDHIKMMLSEPEIAKNTLKMLEYSYENKCQNSGVTAPSRLIKFCDAARPLFK